MRKAFIVAAFIVLTGFQSTRANEISGIIVDSSSDPLAGVVVTLAWESGQRIVTSNSLGDYSFQIVAENTFYYIQPQLANYTFSPSYIAVFLVSGSAEDQDFTSSLGSITTSPLDTAEFFVRQQYVDLLRREPDESGLNFWSSALKACTTQACKNEKRRDIMCAFIASGDYQARFTGVTITVCE